MQKRRSEKGITILILVITIIVLMLISVPVVINTTEVGKLQKYTYFKADIDRLKETIDMVYLNSTDLSSIGPEYTGGLTFLSKTQNGQNVKNPNDGDTYYIINLSNLNKYVNAQIDLNYGEGNKDVTLFTTDKYIINEQSRTIYYVNGITYNDNTYYRLPEEFTETSDVYTVTYDANGGTNAPDMETVETTGTATVTLGTAPTLTGKTFTGWLEEGTSTIYSAGTTYTVTKSTNFIAQWQ